jgi:iron complex transport system ATP-binding protein
MPPLHLPVTSFFSSHAFCSKVWNRNTTLETDSIFHSAPGRSGDSKLPVVSLRGIALFRGERPVLQDISLTIRAGEHWVILGPNGSGKSTLLDVIAGYLWPSEGEVSVLGSKYGRVDLRLKRRQIGLVTSALFERIPGRETCLEVVLSGRFASFGLYDKVREPDLDRAREIVAFLGCRHAESRPFGLLSFGERQLTLIGRALMAEPRLLILDEPCEGLDLGAREKILGVIESLSTPNGGPTLLLVTHRVEEIPPGISHALVLKEGRVLAAGPKETTLTSEALTLALDHEIELMRMKGRYYALVK